MMSSMMSLLHLFQTSSQKGCKSYFYSPFYYFHSIYSHQRVELFSISLFTFLDFFPMPNVYKESLISTKKIDLYSPSRFLTSDLCLSHSFLTSISHQLNLPPLTLILLTRGDSCHTKHYLLLLLSIT